MQNKCGLDISTTKNDHTLKICTMTYVTILNSSIRNMQKTSIHLPTIRTYLTCSCNFQGYTKYLYTKLILFVLCICVCPDFVLTLSLLYPNLADVCLYSSKKDYYEDKGMEIEIGDEPSIDLQAYKPSVKSVMTRQILSLLGLCQHRNQKCFLHYKRDTCQE